MWRIARMGKLPPATEAYNLLILKAFLGASGHIAATAGNYQGPKTLISPRYPANVRPA
jgi:hypothetical protein